MFMQTRIVTLHVLHTVWFEALQITIKSNSLYTSEVGFYFSTVTDDTHANINNAERRDRRFQWC
jgi:hypothetical protein